MTTLYRSLALLLPLALFLLAGTTTTTHAQYPRMILFEQGTAIDLLPAYTGNEALNALLQEPRIAERVLPIKWYYARTGKDVMVGEDGPMHRSRIDYYSDGIFFLGRAVVNGRLTVPSDTGDQRAGFISDHAAFRRAFDEVPATSPVLITVNQTPTSNLAGEIEVTIESNREFADKRLHIALVEAYHYHETTKGGYDQQHYQWIARKMLLGNEGSPISIGPDTTVTVTQSYSLLPAWNHTLMYAVAWVQDDETKEVIQAGTSQTRVIVEVAQPDAVRTALDAPVTWGLEITTDSGSTYGLALYGEIPEGWSNKASSRGEAVATPGPFTLDATRENPLSVTIDPSSATGPRASGTTTVEITGPQGAHYRRTFRLYDNDPDVLLFQRHAGFTDNVDYFDEALQTGTRSYVVIERRDEGLFTFDEGVSILEYGKWAPSIEDTERLSTAIDAGGTRLFMIGAEIGYSLADPANTSTTDLIRNEEFFNNYLHAGYVRDANTAGRVTGFAEDPIGAGLSYDITGGAGNQDAPDEIRALDGTNPIFYYGNDTSAVAGLRFADTRNRLVYLAFGAEGIESIEERQTVLDRGIDWLLGSDLSSTGEEEQTRSGVTIAGAMPVARTLSLRLDRGVGRYSARLYNALGKLALMHSGSLGTANTIHLELGDLPGGHYRLVMTTSEGIETLPVVVVR